MHLAERLALTYGATADKVSCARVAVATLGEELGMIEPALGDLKLMVTEACTNVVRHAYPRGGEGTFEVEAAADEGELAVTIRDFGGGFRPTMRRSQDDSMKLGLGLISQLSSHFEIGDGPDGGTVVLMRIRLAD